MEGKNIRNFSIIAHIDHGKSTLADRLLQITGTIPERKMREQVLDSMDLERERGITIKMTPVRMMYHPNGTFDDSYLTPDKGGQMSKVKSQKLSNSEYVLNLIDTPGHIDFSYEVSRSLKAVEGALLLVDATQGVQAQTLTTLAMAQELGLVIIPVITKIDSNLAQIEDTTREIVTLLKCDPSAILRVSGKTGEGVKELLAVIIERIPPPNEKKMEDTCQALVFDFEYSPHRGVVVYVRVFGGGIKKGDQLLFGVTREAFQTLEVGVFSPEQVAKDALHPGEIGYVVTGLKEPGKALVGDTITSFRNEASVLPGYQHPQPVVWASLYPESQDEFSALRQALMRLKLSDSSLSFEEEMSPTLGRGFRCGFLGMLHLEIVVERLKREYNLELILTAPSIVYEAEFGKEERKKIYSPAQFPSDGTYVAVYEPWAKINIITPLSKVGDIMQLLYVHEAEVGESESFSNDRVRLEALIPLRELMRGFFDEMKSVSSGYASLSYEPYGMKKAQVARLDVLVAEELVSAFSQIVSKHKVYEEAKKIVERLYNLIPPQLFPVKIQGVAAGRILSSKTISALKKDVTGYLYGGDITRKRKLWEKQKKGKKKLKERGRVTIPHDVFLKMIKQE
ncbi:MAG TPA: translation elongation factor 4 [Candidatus Paceibacterota bacterium]